MMFPSLVFKNLNNPANKSSKSDDNSSNHQRNQNFSLFNSHINKSSTVSSSIANNLMLNQNSFIPNTLNTSMSTSFNILDKKSSKKLLNNKAITLSNSLSSSLSSQSSSNESLLANLNARAVFISNLISNSTQNNDSNNFNGLIPSMHLSQLNNESSILTSFGLNPAAAFTMATNEYFNRYLQSLNTNIQYEKVNNNKLLIRKKTYK